MTMSVETEGHSVDSLGIYLRQVGRHPLLDAEGFKAIAARMAAGHAAADQLLELAIGDGYEQPAQYDSDADSATTTENTDEEALASEETVPASFPSVIEQRRALRRAVADGEVAKEQLIEHNLRLAVKIATIYRRKRPNLSLELLDIVQEGNIGLMGSAGKFDYSKGFTFATYASRGILGSIIRGTGKTAYAIGEPVKVNISINNIARAEAKLSAELGRTPSDEEVAREMKITTEELEDLKLWRSRRSIDSFDQPATKSGNITLQEVVPDSTDVIDDMIDTLAKKKLAEDLLGDLEDREQEILRWRYGFKDGEAHTLEEVGEKFGLTRERIRQIEAKALPKLRVAAHDRGISLGNLFGF